MNHRRAAPTAFALLGLIATLIITMASPSSADPKKLLVSSSANGPFQSNLATPLFKDSAKFVPLDEATSTFWVKNNSKQTARTTVSVVNRGTTNDFEKALTFDVDIQGTTSSGTVPAPGSPGCSLVTTGPSIAPGKVQRVDVSLAVADLQQQIGMDQAASLDFVVTLTQTGKNGQVEVCGEQAVAQPEVKGEQATSDGNGNGSTGNGEQCRDVVVTVAGPPTCVPTAVDAGATYGGGEPRDPREIAVLSVVLVATGAGVLAWAGRRRRRVEA